MSKKQDDELVEALLAPGDPGHSLLQGIREVADGERMDSPRWDYWKQIGVLKIWQAILLSCNEDPVWRTTQETYTEGDTIIWGGLSSKTNGKAVTRLDVAKSRVGVDIPVFSPDPERLGRSTVELVKFVEWANDLGWDMPQKLKEIAALDQRNTKGGESWPWGSHNTNLLKKLAEAATKFWSLYDPKDATTAPTNKQVIDWLIDEGVAKRTAEVMATILRADNLPTGPRT